MSEETRAQSLIKSLESDKEISEEFSRIFQDSYIIFGKTPRQWRSHFRISIAEDPDPVECKRLAAKTADLYQDAAFYYAVAEAQADAISSGKEKEYAAAFGRIVAEYKEKSIRMPANDTIKSEATNHVSDLVGAMANAIIVRNFWKRMLNSLTEVRKHIEHATMSNGILVKQEMLLSNPIVGKTPKRETYSGSGDNSPKKDPDW